MDKLFKLAGINCESTSPAHLLMCSIALSAVHKHQFYPAFSDETPTALSTVKLSFYYLLNSQFYTQSTGPITTTALSI